MGRKARIAILIALALVLIVGGGTAWLGHDDAPGAFDAAMAKAKRGDLDGEFSVALMYEHGDGVERNPAEAAKWYRRAADQGDAASQNNLGTLYETGIGVEQSRAEAVSWYRRAAAQGNGDALCNLGRAYEDGEGAPQDSAEAVRLYRRAAEQGLPRGQLYLGLMYDAGTGVPQDAAEAAKWSARGRSGRAASTERPRLPVRQRARRDAERHRGIQVVPTRRGTG
ncbi:sel1 repeat family protein [Burkholderia cepacia]|uniref:Sel1 repeat family protein n=2 Tax=Burkholderia cepacia TaxID=292 RepID=A0AA88YVE8_BURCE|nr:sel1 repeat family protein [Burkholderia cepacia]